MRKLSASTVINIFLFFFFMSLVIAYVGTRNFYAYLDLDNETKTQVASNLHDGWQFYEDMKFENAKEKFEIAASLDDDNVDAMLGLGFSLLQLEEFDTSKGYFDTVLDDYNSKNIDALTGKGLLLWRTEEYEESLESFKKVLEIDDTNPLARDMKYKIEYRITRENGIDSITIPPYVKPKVLQYYAKTHEDFFQIKKGEEWEKMFIKGVNLGVGIPGKFPSQFPRDKEMYSRWLKLMSEMNANTVRLYTILPPEFYEALFDHNTDPKNNRIWLIQGIWAELPPLNNFRNTEFDILFQQEIKDVVDLLHGQAKIVPRPGHASGVYQNNVFPYTLAIILGREWEPYAVTDFNDLYPGDTEFEGTYVKIENANPMEVWLTRKIEFLLEYQEDTYKTQLPITFANWPPLDTLYHISESSYDEERKMLTKAPAKEPPFEVFDNDLEEISMSKVIQKELLKTGIFASYHVYPYYPDFMIYEPKYNVTKWSKKSRYRLYLEELKKVYENMPLLIAEYGIPSSKGIAHLHPEGWHHGGHTEKEQGEIVKKMTEDLVETNMAGGVVFAWIDEWFKKNWIASDLVIPIERNRIWYNAIDPEQSYGLIAMRPGKKEERITLSNNVNEWEHADIYAKNLSDSNYYNFGDGYDDARHIDKLLVASDEGYLYLRLDIENLDTNNDNKPDLDEVNFLIGIDTHGRANGNHKLPYNIDAKLDRGIEYLIKIADIDDAELLVHKSHNSRKEIELYNQDFIDYNLPFRSETTYDGEFEPLIFETNRLRIMRNGKVIKHKTLDMSPMRFGSLDPANEHYNSLADFYIDTKENAIEIRIPWFLLNVSDPSRRAILHSLKDKQYSTLETEGFYFYALSYKPKRYSDDARKTEKIGNITDGIPYIFENTLTETNETKGYTWAKWEIPDYYEEIKESYFIMKEVFGNI